MTPEEIVSRLLYRDGLMLIIDKPAGVAVHKGPKGGPSLEDDFPALQFGLPKPPALAHRLDRETSGCLVLGRHRKALANLTDLFRHGKVGKTYWAVVEGGPPRPEGRIDLALSKLDDNRGWWMKTDPDGLPSSTTWTGDGAQRGLDLARAGAAHRTHAPTARALRGDEMADRRRSTSTAPRHAPAVRVCICMRAKSRCRSIRTASRSK